MGFSNVSIYVDKVKLISKIKMPKELIIESKLNLETFEEPKPRKPYNTKKRREILANQDDTITSEKISAKSIRSYNTQKPDKEHIEKVLEQAKKIDEKLDIKFFGRKNQ